MTTDTAPTEFEMDEYRCQPMMRFPMGSEAELLYFPLKKVANVVSPPEARLLGACGQFATLGDHAERIVSGLPPGSADAAAVVEILRAFETDGMMLSRAELMKRLASLPRPEAQPKIACLAIPTSNRPELLRRAIKSYAVQFSKYGRFPKLLVTDDSRTPEAQRETRAAVEEQATNWGAEVVYSGLEEKKRLIDWLAADGSLPRDVLEFGILGPSGHALTTGGNRNAIMLQSAGEMVLSVDDDTVCQPCAAPGSAVNTLRLGSEGDPAEYWFFPDRESALEFARSAEVDILAAHEALLGRPVWTLAEPPAKDGRVDMNSACGHIIQSICTGNGRVLVTSNGAVGDSGMYSGRNFPVHREPGTRSRLLASEEAYRSALQSREIVRQVSSAVICHGSLFISMFTGMDNRALLPPFFLLGHNEDGILAYTMSRCLETCYFGYLPWSMVHDPPHGRTYFGSAATTARISDLLTACISTWSCPNREACVAERLGSLGRHLCEVASMPSDDFEEYIRTLLWQQTSQRIAHREALLREYGERPDFWAADLRNENLASEAAQTRPDYAAPIDLPEQLTGPERLREAQSLIRRYGELVSWWPRIVERAMEAVVSAPSCSSPRRLIQR